ncbi:MAG: HEAT repeat domain-containing protein, partial [Planctomycetota bacterium]|nr:HEAT repeat domain-containing protein [Planctomycetota bacterium]
MKVIHLILLSTLCFCGAVAEAQEKRSELATFKGKSFSQWARLLEDEDEGIRCLAIHALGKLGLRDKNDIPILIRALNDKSHGPRVLAVFTLKKVAPRIELKKREVINPLIRALGAKEAWENLAWEQRAA